jgi:hypothetical protein
MDMFPWASGIDSRHKQAGIRTQHKPAGQRRKVVAIAPASGLCFADAIAMPENLIGM